ncbi:MAG: carboxypeptidase-like regulatory domain-containing protein, partial [Candidatus Andersenbacteria bacterium]
VWDSYSLKVDGAQTGYDIKETSVVAPFVVTPGATVDVVVTVVPHTDRSLHVTILSLDGEPVDNATVQLTGDGGYDQTRVSGLPGQVFFEDIPTIGTYTMNISAPSHEGQTQQVNIQATEQLRVTMTPTGL